MQVSFSEHQLFASTPGYAEQRLLLMVITVSLAVVVLVVTAATIRSTICFAVHSRILARFLLVSLIHCVPQVENVPMVLH